MSPQTSATASIVMLVVGAAIGFVVTVVVLHWLGKREAKRLAAMTAAERLDDIDRHAL